MKAPEDSRLGKVKRDASGGLAYSLWKLSFYIEAFQSTTETYHEEIKVIGTRLSADIDTGHVGALSMMSYAPQGKQRPK
jgi:hypothetical protein